MSTLSAKSGENTNKGPMTSAQPTNILYFRVSPSGQYCNWIESCATVSLTALTK